MASAVLATSIIDICTNMRDNDTIVKYKILSSHLHLHILQALSSDPGECRILFYECIAVNLPDSEYNFIFVAI